MNLPVSSLPSKGYNYLVSEISMEPLTYDQIIKYSQKSLTGLNKLIWDIDHLLYDIDGFRDFNSYDIKTLLFTRKYISATFNQSFKFRYSDEIVTVNINDISYKDLPDELKLIDSIVLNDHEYQFSIPSIGKFLSVSRTLLERFTDIPINVAMLVSSLCEENTVIPLAREVLNCKGNDILLIEYLSDLLTNPVNDVTVKLKGGETVVDLNNSITDIFQFLKLNQRFDEAKFIIKKEL